MNFFEDHALPIVELIIPFTSQQVLCLHQKKPPLLGDSYRMGSNNAKKTAPQSLTFQPFACSRSTRAQTTHEVILSFGIKLFVIFAEQIKLDTFVQVKIKKLLKNPHERIRAGAVSGGIKLFIIFAEQIKFDTFVQVKKKETIKEPTRKDSCGSGGIVQCLIQSRYTALQPFKLTHRNHC